MVKFNSKRLLAFVVASMMVVGSSVTAFAADGDPVIGDGTGTYEGDDVTFAAIASFTVPSAPTTGFNYIADPNGLIAEAAANGKAAYKDFVFDRTNTHGVYFPTSVADGKTTYSEKSAAVTIVNNNASPLNVSVKIKQKDSDTGNVPFTDDATFGGDTPSTSKAVYIAVTNGTDTAAIKAGGTEVALSYALSGKISNYELKYSTTNSAYEYALKEGVLTTDATKWNSTSFYVTGALNENAKYEKAADSTAVTFPAITVTYDADPGAAPLKIKNGIEAVSGELTVKKAASVSKIYVGSTELVKTTHWTATDATASKGSVITLTPAATKTAYSKVKAMADGLPVTVEYSTGDKEVLVLFAK
jgi:hypothetical protein